jgi:hypothetical protein
MRGRMTSDAKDWQQDHGWGHFGSHHGQATNASLVAINTTEQMPLAQTDSGTAESVDSALVLDIGGYAFASGDNTLADGEIHSQVADLGRVTRAVGTATFVAAADSSAGGQAVVDADTYANVVGADIVIMMTVNSGGTGSDGSALATSTLKVMAIDFEGFDMPGGAIVYDVDISRPSVGSIALGGHLATVVADADATGANTLAETHTYAVTDLSAENHFSFVAGDAISGVA